MMKYDYRILEIIQQGIKYASGSTCFIGISYVPKERNWCEYNTGLRLLLSHT